MSERNDSVVSFDDEPLILVDSEDNILDYEKKWDCHRGSGQLHRAFSIFIFNDKNELLLQKRSEHKPLWPLVWANSCCSHPRKGEMYEEAVHRRLKEELNLEADLKFLYKFEYQASYKDVGSENELCSVYVGKSNAQARANENEVAALRYVAADELDSVLQADTGVGGAEKYSPWLKLEWSRIREEYWGFIEAL